MVEDMKSGNPDVIQFSEVLLVLTDLCHVLQKPPAQDT